jgi:hypothetical protein
MLTKGCLCFRLDFPKQNECVVTGAKPDLLPSTTEFTLFLEIQYHRFVLKMAENEDIRPNESENPSASAGLPITLRPASPTPSSRTLPFGKDYTVWHEQACRPFLLELIHNQTLPEVKSLAASPDVLENEAHEELRRRPAKFLASLGLLDGSMNDLQDQALVKNDEDLEITRPSRSSTSSQSSTNSQSSQLSDSDLNDVQQSILVMLEDLNQGCEELLTLEKGRILSKFGGLSKIVELKNPVAKELQTVFWAVIQLLCDAQNNTVGMGFRMSPSRQSCATAAERIWSHGNMLTQNSRFRT